MTYKQEKRVKENTNYGNKELLVEIQKKYQSKISTEIYFNFCHQYFNIMTEKEQKYFWKFINWTFHCIFVTKFDCCQEVYDFDINKINHIKNCLPNITDENKLECIKTFGIFLFNLINDNKSGQITYNQMNRFISKLKSFYLSKSFNVFKEMDKTFDLIEFIDWFTECYESRKKKIDSKKKYLK